MEDFGFKKKIEKIKAANFEDTSRLIFMWVKSGQINVRNFITLNEINGGKTK